MPYKIKAMNQACKKRRYERNKTFRRRVKRLVFKLRGCAGTLTGKCTWEGDISHVALQFDHRDGEEKKHNICRMDGHSIENIKHVTNLMAISDKVMKDLNLEEEN